VFAPIVRYETEIMRTGVLRRRQLFRTNFAALSAMAHASIILVATVVPIVDAVTRAEPTNNLINKVRELHAALRACWVPPSLAHEDRTISVRLSFKQNGEILGVPLITYMSVGISEDERQAYRAAVDETLARCTPLPLSYAFGSVIAGRPINVRFH
jgi:hypothetical protein